MIARFISWLKSFLHLEMMEEPEEVENSIPSRALLVVDAPNVDPSDLRFALAQMKTVCSDVDIKVYAPQSNLLRSKWEDTCKDLDCPIHTIPVYVRGKVSSDSFLTVETIGLCLENEYKWVGILSSDTDFLHLARFLLRPSIRSKLNATPLMFIDESKTNSSILRFLGSAFVKTPTGYTKRVFEKRSTPKPNLRIGKKPRKRVAVFN